MKKFRFISLMICFVMLFSITCFATETNTGSTLNNNDASIGVKGHGEYKLSSNEVIELDADGNKTKNHFKIRKVDDDIYEMDVNDENMDYNKLIKVKKDTFLRVKEVKVNLLDKDQVEEAIAMYEINSKMADDIRTLSDKAINGESSDSSEITIYTPKMPASANEEEVSGIAGIRVAGWTKTSSSYYTGYNGEKYLDEIYKITGSSGPQEVITGSQVKNYLKTTIRNLADYIQDEVPNQLTGGAYTLVTLFGTSITTYASNSEDYWYANLQETKYRKYTSIYLYDSLLQKYVYSIKAYAEKDTAYFIHTLWQVNRGGDPVNKNDTSKTYITPNYNALDQKAYEYQYDSYPYTEYFDYFAPNDLTRFDSIS